MTHTSIFGFDSEMVMGNFLKTEVEPVKNVNFDVDNVNRMLEHLGFEKIKG